MLKLKISRKKCIWFASACLAFLLGWILLVITNRMAGILPDQLEGQRWSDKNDAAQVSVFLSTDDLMTPDQVVQFSYQLNQAMVEKSITVESENPSARLFAYAYSGRGKITISSDRSSGVSVNALGVGGDFFLFHPLELSGGYYFPEDRLNDDCIVLDEVTAWKLFGSYDIAGKMVYLGDKPLFVSGVVHLPDSKLAQKAGLLESIVFLPYSVMEEMNACLGINSFEIVMPNPVKDWARTEIQRQFTENLGKNEINVETVDNTARFSFMNRFTILRNLTDRAMNAKAIIYPYWENMARGLEGRLAIFALFYMVCFIYTIGVNVILIILWWKGGSLQHGIAYVLHQIPELIYSMQSKMRYRKQNKKDTIRGE